MTDRNNRLGSDSTKYGQELHLPWVWIR